MPEIRPVQEYDRSLQGPHYFGQRQYHGCEVYHVTPGFPPMMEELDLAASLKISNHSPAGFEWGYAGSGPAQLALAILLHATKDAKIARELHQRFKFAFVRYFPSDSWQLTELTVATWCNRILATERQPGDE